MHHLQTRYGGILTCDEAAHVMKETNNARKLRQLIDILREKGDKECHIFCRILGMDGSSSNASWATIVEAPECQAEECTQRMCSFLHVAKYVAVCAWCKPRLENNYVCVMKACICINGSVRIL